MQVLGAGLSEAGRHEDVLAVDEARFEMLRRHGESGQVMLSVMGNLASTYGTLGRDEEALQMRRDVYSGWLELFGEEHRDTLKDAFNYAVSLVGLRRFEEAKSLLRKTIPVARRVIGDGHILTLKMRKVYAKALFFDGSATLDDLREAVTTLEDAERIARRVFGGAHPLTSAIEDELRDAQAALRAREAPSPSRSESS
jgi:hypothetical protein